MSKLDNDGGIWTSDEQCPHCGAFKGEHCIDTTDASVPARLARGLNLKPGDVIPVENAAAVRAFGTGATRSADAGRYDPEGFMSPLVVERFCEYMQKHRVQPDGSVRGSDNWQKGMPRETYIKGMWRHFLHAWTRHRGLKVRDAGAAADIEEDLCALLFNVQGYLYEILKAKESENGS